jgi:hypothetical protein
MEQNDTGKMPDNWNGNALKTVIKWILFLTAASAMSVFFGCSKESRPPVYRLRVWIDPAGNRIEGLMSVGNPPSSRFFLNNRFKILGMSADGQTIPYRRDTTAYMPYTVGTVVQLDTVIRGELRIEYEGTLPDTVNGVNMIKPGLVELALYAAWYPMFEKSKLFDFELQADMPSDFISVSNGVLKRRSSREGRTLTRWASLKPGFDIVLLASPRLRLVEEKRKGVQIEMAFSKLPPDYIEAKKDSLIRAMDRLSSFYGPPRVKGFLRFVYSPRNGWGYSRIPFFVVPEEYALTLWDRPFGREMDFHGAAHEMAHFWWMIADAETPDDWINEGLAEYSAFRVSEACSGPAFARRLADEYRRHASKSRTATPIAETRMDSEDVYVNRYEKTALIFIEAGNRFGTEPMDRFLKSLHSRFAGSRKATTALFLEEAGKRLGSDAEAYFRKCLFDGAYGTGERNAGYE